MIISLIGSVLGMAGGLIPDIFKEFKQTREHGRELERMEKQSAMQLELAKAQIDGKLEVAKVEGYAAETKAHLDQVTSIIESQSRPTGIPWVDSFNSLLRPLTAAMIMLLFISTSVMYVFGVMGLVGLKVGGITIQLAAQMIWGSLVGDSIQAVLGFLFGYRSTKGRVGATRG
jgi:hypothetical protein